MRLNRRQERRGVAAVELALLLPFLVFLFVLAVDYGRIFFFSVTITNCARAGAVWASDPFEQSESPYTTVSQAALAEAPNFSPQPSVSSAYGADANGDPYVDVTVTGTFNTITRYPGVPSSTTLTRRIRMRVAPNAPAP
jgi:Flp pilus assembly protein TadG